MIIMKFDFPEMLLEVLMMALSMVLVFILFMIRAKRRRQEKLSAVAEQISAEFKPGTTAQRQLDLQATTIRIPS